MIEKTLELMTVYLQHNQVPAADLPRVIQEVHRTLLDLEKGGATPQSTAPVPPVRIEDSITDDYLVCLEDGRRLKILKRHLNQNYGLTPEEYRKKWGLPDDYPMVARNYALQRSGIAKQQGLGKKKS